MIPQIPEIDRQPTSTPPSGCIDGSEISPYSAPIFPSWTRKAGARGVITRHPLTPSRGDTKAKPDQLRIQ